MKITLILLSLGIVLSGVYLASWRWWPSRRESWRWAGTWLTIAGLLVFVLWLYGYADLIGWVLRWLNAD